MLTNVWRRLCLPNLKHFSASDCVRMLYFLYGSHYEVRMKFVIQPADSRKKVERFFLTNWGIHSNFSISISDRPARDLRVNRRISVIRQSQLRVEIKVSAQSRELSVKIRISRINLIRLRRFTLWVGLHQFYAMGHFEATQCSPRHSQVRRRTSGTLNSSPSHWLGVSFVHRFFRSPSHRPFHQLAVFHQLMVALKRFSFVWCSSTGGSIVLLAILICNSYLDQQYDRVVHSPFCTYREGAFIRLGKSVFRLFMWDTLNEPSRFTPASLWVLSEWLRRSQQGVNWSSTKR